MAQTANTLHISQEILDSAENKHFYSGRAENDIPRRASSLNARQHARFPPALRPFPHGPHREKVDMVQSSLWKKS